MRTTRSAFPAGAFMMAAGALFCLALPVFSQTNPTGTISGKVLDPQGLPVPSVGVTAQSPALQGTRSATTSSNGDYILPFLPPGDYVVQFERSGFRSVQETARVSPGVSLALNASLSLSTVAESVTVIDLAPGDFGQGAQVATSIKKDLVEKLPLGRTLLAITLLAPGVQNSGANNGVVISGAPSFDSLYLVDGVVVNENVRNQPLNLFIEDALQETTISTAALSAEYGRFGGGVVNAITKSGGNDFSGSYRITLDNDKWTALTPFPNDSRTDDVIPTHEATLGGAVLKDKLWFFGAARLRNSKQSLATSFTNIGYERSLDEKRYEGKLTWAITKHHSVKGAYTHIDSLEDNGIFQTIMDLKNLIQRVTPQKLLSANYTGILSPTFFVEAQYSRRDWSNQTGSRFTDIVQGTPIFDQSRGNARYNSPSFCFPCGVDSRDNQNFIVKASTFLSTSRTGSHNLVFGVDVFDDKRLQNNYQSGSNYQIVGTSAIIRGTDIFPVLDNRSFINWVPILVLSEGNRYRTISGFVNDAWTFNKRWTLNVGLRYDKNDGKDAVGDTVVTSGTLSPRLSVSFDPKGDGRWTLNAGYGRYVAAIAQNLVGAISAGGRPAVFAYDYLGPAINVGNPANPVTAEQAIRTVFDWFNANGGTNRPTRGAPTVPGVNTKVSEDLKSPTNDEFTLGLSRRLGDRGAIRVDGVLRKFRDSYGNRIDLSTGRVADQFGRQFDVQVNYRLRDRLALGGNYTLSDLQGNFDGETPGAGPVGAPILSYPEYFDRAWAFPAGDLLADSRHKLRAWVTWETPLPAALGSASLSVLESFSSGSPYVASGTVDTRPFVANPGYATAPALVPYYFLARDAIRAEGAWSTDLSVQWSRKLGLKKAEVFFRGIALNVFNLDTLTDGTRINSTILTNRTTAALARFDPFTATPTEGTHWRRGPVFGQPTSRFAYQTPRTFSFSLGLRF